MTNDILVNVIAEHTSSLRELTREVSEIRQVVAAHVAKEEAMVTLVSRAFTVGTSVTGCFVVTLVGIIGWLLTHPGLSIL